MYLLQKRIIFQSHLYHIVVPDPEPFVTIARIPFFVVAVLPIFGNLERFCMNEVQFPLNNPPHFITKCETGFVLVKWQSGDGDRIVNISKDRERGHIDNSDSTPWLLPSSCLLDRGRGSLIGHSRSIGHTLAPLHSNTPILATPPPISAVLVLSWRASLLHAPACLIGHTCRGPITDVISLQIWGCVGGVCC